MKTPDQDESGKSSRNSPPQPHPEFRDTVAPPRPEIRDTENRHIKKNGKKQNTDPPPPPPAEALATARAGKEGVSIFQKFGTSGRKRSVPTIVDMRSAFSSN